MANVININTGEYRKSVHTPDYIGNPDWIINPTQEQIDQYTPGPSLADAKAVKINEIQTNTANFIAQGFEHPTNNLIVFGLDTMWQSNWNTLRAEFLDESNPNDEFPYEVGTIDAEDYIIANYQEFKDIYKAGKARKKYLIKGERMIIQDIKQADTIAEVEAITDDRV